jgi:SAM-dependent methyltransferase
MEGYEAATYGDLIAGIYDELYDEMFDVDATVRFLADEARGGGALELGIGTGRVALPLTEMGVAVQGVDASSEMVARMRAKPGSSEIPVIMGDFGTAELGGPYSLVYIVFNTFFALTSQDAQIGCFRNVERALEESGVFVIEAFVPDMSRFDRDQRVGVERMDLNRVMLDVSRHDPAEQRIDSQHVIVSENGIVLRPVHLRYAWPSELDLMARLCGLSLRDRYSSWRREPFTSASGGHVSVYQKASVPA